MSGSSTSSYVKDVPVRLNRKFYPLLRCDGPLNAVIDCPVQFPMEVVAEEYCFTAEKKALQEFHSSLQLRSTIACSDEHQQQDSHSSVDNVPATITCNTLPALSTNGTVAAASREEHCAVTASTDRQLTHKTPAGITTSVNTVVSSFRPLLTNGILQPTVVKAPPVRSENVERAPDGPGLRLEDFESVGGGSPFDMVELKSINDIEELRRLCWSQQQQQQQQSKEYVS